MSWIVVQTETLMDAIKKETWSRRIRPQDWTTMRWLLKSNYRTDRGKRWPEGPKKKKGGAGKDRKSWDIVFFEIPKVTWWYGYETSGTCKAKSRWIDWGQRLPHSLMSPQPHCSYFGSHYSKLFCNFLLFWWSKMVAYWIETNSHYNPLYINSNVWVSLEIIVSGQEILTFLPVFSLNQKWI